MSPFAPSSRPRRFEVALLLSMGVAACDEAEGKATVRAQFLTEECRAGTHQPDLRNYHFDAEYMYTERFAGIFGIIIQRSRAEVEETDALQVRFSLQKLIDADIIRYDRDFIVR